MIINEYSAFHDSRVLEMGPNSDFLGYFRLKTNGGLHVLLSICFLVYFVYNSQLVLA